MRELTFAKRLYKHFLWDKIVRYHRSGPNPGCLKHLALPHARRLYLTECIHWLVSESQHPRKIVTLLFTITYIQLLSRRFCGWVDFPRLIHNHIVSDNITGQVRIRDPSLPRSRRLSQNIRKSTCWVFGTTSSRRVFNLNAIRTIWHRKLLHEWFIKAIVKPISSNVR